jgi:hypothetical protein
MSVVERKSFRSSRTDRPLEQAFDQRRRIVETAGLAQPGAQFLTGFGRR